MQADLIRAQAPVGSDRTIVTTRGAELRVTVVQHHGGNLFAGSHPDLLSIPYADIDEIRKGA